MAGVTETVLAGVDKDRMIQAVDILLDARRTVRPIHDLPAELRPKSLVEAYYAQDRMLEALGDAGGWKVGASTPDAPPLYAPMPVYTIARSGTRLAETFRRMRGVEAEIAFLMKKDLPPRSTPYTREEALDAIASCHPAIEVLESAISDPDQADPLTGAADLLLNGGFIYGDAIVGWQDFDFSTESAEMKLDGIVRAADGKSPMRGDLVRLMLWLINHAQGRTGGRLAGQWITTGSWTGKLLAGKGSEAVAQFRHCGSAVVYFS